LIPPIGYKKTASSYGQPSGKCFTFHYAEVFIGTDMRFPEKFVRQIVVGDVDANVGIDVGIVIIVSPPLSTTNKNNNEPLQYAVVVIFERL
jgi:hypothetical protein